jgi:hypothetical protein
LLQFSSSLLSVFSSRKQVVTEGHISSRENEIIKDSTLSISNENIVSEEAAELEFIQLNDLRTRIISSYIGFSH